MVRPRNGSSGNGSSPLPKWIGWVVTALIIGVALYKLIQESFAPPPTVKPTDKTVASRPIESQSPVPSSPQSKPRPQPVLIDPPSLPKVTPPTAVKQPVKPQAAPATNPIEKSYRVTHVADGDTFNLSVPGEPDNKARVRLIGINCPEIAHPEKNPPTKAQPFSSEAQRFTERVIRENNNRLRVEHDPDYEERDHYGRWLCWAYYVDSRTGEEKLLNEELVRQGLAFVYDDRRRFNFSESMYRRLKAAQREAQQARRGIYGDK